MTQDEIFMKEALKEAAKARKKDEVPIGAIIVHNNKIIAKGHNLRETKHDALGHAEIIAIRKANKKLKSWRLVDCTIYVTVEPCSMCAGAILQSRIGRIVYGTEDIKGGALGSSYNLFESHTLQRPRASCHCSSHTDTIPLQCCKLVSFQGRTPRFFQP